MLLLDQAGHGLIAGHLFLLEVHWSGLSRGLGRLPGLLRHLVTGEHLAQLDFHAHHMVLHVAVPQRWSYASTELQMSAVPRLNKASCASCLADPAGKPA